MGIYSRDEIEKILKQYGDTIYRMAFVQVKKHDVAEDIYQEVCVKLLKQKARIEPEEHLKAWLLRTAINCCKDYWKSAWVKRLSWKEIEETSEVTVNAEEHDGYLTECVWRLPEKYRSLIHLYYYEDYSQKEIAEMLHMKENTVAIRLLRGREKLREMLMKEDRNYEF
ncbi:MAG: sigma-70 family RNA polymerase sigma factor [Lachnospiraceae bacterium]|nr:sigma-70 family RNA polymerase sigma factor [Lachnospiraceae bacterium]